MADTLPPVYAGAPNRPRVLVVDDEIVIRLAVASYLRDHGAVVCEAANAAEAIALLKANVPIDVVLTDIQMPGTLDGLDLAHWIDYQWPDKIIILACGDPIASDAKGHRGNKWQCLKKPYNLADLLRHVLDAPRLSINAQLISSAIL